MYAAASRMAAGPAGALPPSVSGGGQGAGNQTGCLRQQTEGAASRGAELQAALVRQVAWLRAVLRALAAGCWRWLLGELSVSRPLQSRAHRRFPRGTSRRVVRWEPVLVRTQPGWWCVRSVEPALTARRLSVVGGIGKYRPPDSQVRAILRAEFQRPPLRHCSHSPCTAGTFQRQPGS